MVKHKAIRRIIGKVVLLILLVLVAAIGAKTAIDFSAWSYSHTGLRFRIGAHLLPAIVFVVFLYTYSTLPPVHKTFPVSPAGEEKPTKTIISE